MIVLACHLVAVDVRWLGMELPMVKTQGSGNVVAVAEVV